MKLITKCTWNWFTTTCVLINLAIVDIVVCKSCFHWMNKCEYNFWCDQNHFGQSSDLCYQGFTTIQIFYRSKYVSLWKIEVLQCIKNSAPFGFCFQCVILWENWEPIISLYCANLYICIALQLPCQSAPVTRLALNSMFYLVHVHVYRFFYLLTCPSMTLLAINC